MSVIAEPSADPRLNYGSTGLLYMSWGLDVKMENHDVYNRNGTLKGTCGNIQYREGQVRPATLHAHAEVGSMPILSPSASPYAGTDSLPAPSRVKNRDPNRGEPVAFFCFSLISFNSCLPAWMISACLDDDLVLARSGVATGAGSSPTGDFLLLPSILLGLGTGIPDGEVICVGLTISIAFRVACCVEGFLALEVSGAVLEVALAATLTMFREGTNAGRSR